MDIKKLLSVGLCCATFFSLSACQQNPESSIVRNKDFNNLIEQANAENGADVLSQDYDIYKTDISDPSLFVSAHINAKADIPQSSSMSIYRVKRAEDNQSKRDAIRSVLVGNSPLYDSSFLNVRTKKYYEKLIAEIKQSLQRLYSDFEKQEGEIASQERSLEKLLSEYENAPDRVTFPDRPTDRGYGVTDGADGSYVMYDVYTDGGVSYMRSPYGYTTPYVTGRFDILLGEYIIQGAATDGDILLGNSGIDWSDNVSTYVFPEDVCTLSKENAVQQADSFLKNVGLSDFGFYDGDIYTERVNVRLYDAETGLYRQMDDLPDTAYYRTYYILRYKRKIDGAFLINDYVKYSEEENTVSDSWLGEDIYFRINDNGIVGFDWTSPIEIIETVAQNAALKSFDEIKEIFEKMLPVVYGSTEMQNEIEISRIRLAYTRISEPDSYDTGLIVPVWDFIGRKTVYNIYNGETGDLWRKDELEISQFSVNAIDGSVINGQLGY